MKGALDFVMNDIHPEGDNAPDFFNHLEDFGSNVGTLLMETLPELDFVDMERGGAELLQEILDEVKYQFANPMGPDFFALMNLSGMYLLSDDQKMQILRGIRDGVIKGTS